jgi:hypothetical protein
VRKMLFMMMALPLVSAGCSSAGSGSGSRATRPDFKDSGTIFDNGGQNQTPPENPNYNPTNPQANIPPTPVMNPQALQILATCFDLPQGASEVVTVVGWTDPGQSVTQANALCNYLAKASYPSTIPPSRTLQPADIDK